MRVLLLLVGSLGLMSSSAVAQTAGTPVAVCGTLTDYRAPQSNSVGSVIVSAEQFFISTDARPNVSPDAKAGTEVCLEGAWVPHAVGRSLIELKLTPQPGATPTPPTRMIIHENAVLGYRISLPETYRRWFGGAAPQGADTDIYTRRIVRAESDLCERTLDMDSDIKVEVVRTEASPSEFVSAPNRRIVFTTVQAVTVNGYAAAKVMHEPSGDTALYAIRANDRLYVFAPEADLQPSRQPQGWLDQIAASFTAAPPSPPAAETRTSPCVSTLPSTTTSDRDGGRSISVVAAIALALLASIALFRRRAQRSA